MFSNYIHWLLKYHQEQKSIKLPFGVYADFFKLSLKRLILVRITLKYPISQKLINIQLSIFPFLWHLHITNLKKNRQSFYRGADYMVKYCDIAKNTSKEITNTEHTKNVSIFLLNKLNQENMSMCVTFVMRNFHVIEMNYWKVQDDCHFTGKFRVAAHSALNLRYSIPRKIPVILHNVSNHHFHFMISIRT